MSVPTRRRPLTDDQRAPSDLLVVRAATHDELLQVAWRDEPADEHAVETTVTRLRTALGPAGGVVQTVVKRGYRLAAADL